MKRIARWCVALVVGALAGCQTAPDVAATRAATGTGAAALVVGDTAGHESCAHARGTPGGEERCGGSSGGAAHEGCGACGGEPGAAPARDEVRTVADPATGELVTLVGANVGAAEVVKTADLLASPRDYVGKRVRLEGNVSAMCEHRRAWFTVQADDRSGRAVRVVAAPAFLVPAGSVGKRVRTEGVVELAAQQAGSRGGTEDGNRVLLRATGAELR